MEMNRNEAERCVDIAEQFIKARDKEKAEQFLHRAQCLFPLQRAKNLLNVIQTVPVTPAEEYINKEITIPLYTHDEYETVKRIENCNNYYEMLQVDRDACYIDIKKAYKKLALRLHPDKNKCPGAAEAFKTLGNAVAALTDPYKRKQHDLSIFEGRLFRNRKHLNEQNKNRRSYRYSCTSRNIDSESPVTLQELFNTLYKGGSGNCGLFPNRNSQAYKRNFIINAPSDDEQQGDIFAKLMKLLHVQRVNVHRVKQTSSTTKGCRKRNGSIFKY